jgi:hypothetical protein
VELDHVLVAVTESSRPRRPASRLADGEQDRSESYLERQTAEGGLVPGDDAALDP